MSNLLNRDRFNGAPSPKEMERDKRRRKLWLREFGVEPPKWEPIANEPEITEELRAKLRSLVRGDLPHSIALDIHKLLVRHRSVAACYSDILNEELFDKRA